jgi:hypothetical protein
VPDPHAFNLSLLPYLGCAPAGADCCNVSAL